MRFPCSTGTGERVAGVKGRSIYGYFTNCALANASVSDDVALFVGLELLDGMYPPIDVFALSLVDTAVGSGRDETENGVLVSDTFAGGIAFRSVHAHGVCDEEITGPLVEHDV